MWLGEYTIFFRVEKSAFFSSRDFFQVEFRSRFRNQIETREREREENVENGMGNR